MGSYLSEDVKVTLVQAALADGQTDPDSSSVDMSGYDGVMFIGVVGTITGSGTANLIAAQSSDDSTFATLSGMTATKTAAAQSDTTMILDVQRPADRYVRTTLTRAVANSVYGGTIAIQYKARSLAAAAALANSIVRGITPAETT
jgi:hypothetical protein